VFISETGRPAIRQIPAQLGGFSPSNSVYFNRIGPVCLAKRGCLLYIYRFNRLIYKYNRSLFPFYTGLWFLISPVYVSLDRRKIIAGPIRRNVVFCYKLLFSASIAFKARLALPAASEFGYNLINILNPFIASSSLFKKNDILANKKRYSAVIGS